MRKPRSVRIVPLVRPGVTLRELPGVVQHTRILRGLTMKQAGGQIGVSASMLCRLERGHIPTADALAALATWMRLPIVINPEDV